MVKKLLPVTLCAAMLLSCFMAGCTDKPDESVTSDAIDAPVSSEQETAESAETEEITDGETTADDTDPAETNAEEKEPALEPTEYTFPQKPVLVGSKRIASVAIRHGENTSEAYAAAELQAYLEKVKVPVRADGEYPITVCVDPTLEQESYRIEITKSEMTISGGSGRGVIYGVYYFLEKYVSIRFFTPDLEIAQDKKPIQLYADTVIEHSPTFELRQTNWVISQDAVWSLKNGLNCHDGLTDEMGGTWTYGAWIHTIGWMTGHGGVGQPCLSDPQNLANAIASVRSILAQNPDADIISVSQNDNDDYCKCEACAAIDEIEGSPSGSIIRFVNAIAADIAVDYPNVVIDTLAYRYSQAAPKVTKPLPNVCVRMAPLLSCFTHAYNDPDCPRNAQFAQDLVDWSKICDRIYIWDYTTNFTYFVPTFENLFAIRENMKFFAEHNVKGIFAQGNDQCPSGEFGELRAYLLTRLMNDPLMTRNEYYEHMDEFLKAYYGEGWRYIRNYIDATSNQTGIYCRGCYGAPLEAFDRDRYAALADSIDSWWDKAEELAGDRLEYVQRSRLQWRYLKLMLRPNEEEAKTFIADIAAAGIHWKEWRYTSAIGEGSNLSKSPDKWIYD